MIDLWTLPLAENGEDTARSQTNSWRSENLCSMYSGRIWLGLLEERYFRRRRDSCLVRKGLTLLESYSIV